MAKPVSEWDEDYILSLPKESDEFERKGSKKLDLNLASVDENDVRTELAKQLSAFANVGGGQIIYGVKNDGSTDGGVSPHIKKGGTKEWLEDQVSGLTEFEIIGTNVFEVNSKIHPDKPFYVIDVPDSDRAPHQSRQDKLYYVRLNSKSQPAPHRMIEDIRNRQKHPSISIDIVKPRLHGVPKLLDHRGHYAIGTMLNLVVTNNGTLKSADTFLLLNPEQGYLSGTSDTEIATMVRGTKSLHYMWQLARPLPPQSEISFAVEYHFQGRFTSHPSCGKVWTVFDGDRSLNDVSMGCTVFADSAPPRSRRMTMAEIGLISLLNDAVT